MNVVVSFENVSFGYSEDLMLFRNVSLKIYENEFITVVGPNGSGKTTFVKIILGLLRPREGRVLVLGKDPKDYSGKIGYVPQIGNFDVQFPITVEEVLFGGVLKPFGRIFSVDKERIKALAEELKISDLMRKSFSSLSGGQQQRVLIARALASSPCILVLDEPSSNIDMEGEEIVNSLLERLKGWKTIIVVTHDTGFVNDLTDRTICISGGKVKEHGVTPDKALAEIFGCFGKSKKVLHAG
ncbi:MAG: metal ABC transporter ATP-binding protein [Brevinematia bacterium]